jgi:hypothetical protein
MGSDVHVLLAASRRSDLQKAVQLLLLLLRYQSSRASGVPHPILVSRLSLLHHKRSPAVSLLQSQQLRARSSTTLGEKSRLCDYWKRHTHGEWQQKQQHRQRKQQEQQQQQE